MKTADWLGPKGGRADVFCIAIQRYMKYSYK